MATKFLDYTGLAYLWQKIKAYFTTLLALKADDANVVHKTGNETINGRKTFKSFIKSSPADTSPALIIMPPDTYSDRATVLDNISVLDNTSNNYRISLIRSVDKDPNGNRLLNLYVFPTSGVITDSSYLSVGLLDIDNAAVPFAQAPSTLEYEADGVTKRTSGRDIVTRDWIPKDDRIVHTTGNELITGVKVFHTNEPDFIGRNKVSRLVIKNDNVLKGTAPEHTIWSQLLFTDNSNNSYETVDNVITNRLGILEYYVSPNTSGIQMAAYKQSTEVSEQGSKVSLLVSYDENGVGYAQSPSTSSLRNNGQDILTRDWIPNDTRIVHRTGNEVVYDDKVFINTIYKEAAVVHKETENFDGSSLYENILAFNHTASSLSNKSSVTVGFQRVKNIYNLGLSSELNFTIANKLDKFYHVYFGITDSNVCYIRSDHSSDIVDDLGSTLTVHKIIGPDKTYEDLAVSRYYDSANETPTKRGAVLRYSRNRSGNTPYNTIQLLALDNNNTSLQGIIVENRGGTCTCYAPNTATDSAGNEIVTAYWVRALLNSTLANYVTLDTDQRISGSKRITNNPIYSVANYTQDTTLSSNTQIQKFAYLVESNDNKQLGNFFTCRENFGSYKNYSAIRAYSCNNRWGDLVLYNTDSGYVYAQVNAHGDLKNDGFHGLLRGRIIYALSSDTSSYWDPIEIRDTTDATRLSTIRVNRVSATHWAVLLGVNKINNSAPGGLSVSYKTTGEDIYVESPDLFPSFDNTYLLGSSSKRWKQIFAVTGTINTSDARYKDDISLVDDKLLEAWDSIDWKQFKFIDAVNEKGRNKARIHSGLIAQDIQSVFIENDIDPNKYGFFCYDKWDKEETSYAPDGELLYQGIEAGDRYSLRYEEVLCIEAAYQRRKNKILENRISELEKRLAKLEGIV